MQLTYEWMMMLVAVGQDSLAATPSYKVSN